MPEDYEIYQPDLDKIKRLEADRFFKQRQEEFAIKVEEIELKPDKQKWLWLIYGWLLQTSDEAEKLKSYVEDIPILGFLLKYYCKIMRWQSKRLKVD